MTSKEGNDQHRAGVCFISHHSAPITSGLEPVVHSRPPKINERIEETHEDPSAPMMIEVWICRQSTLGKLSGQPKTCVLGSSYNYISYLPLAHIYERANQVMNVTYGVAVGFYQGDNLKLMDDMAVLRPNIFCSVPRLYNRIYASIMNAVKQSGGLKERLFNAAYNAKKQALLTGTDFMMWHCVTVDLSEKLGGRVRMICSSASSLSPDVIDFLKICFGGQVTEGYGMTETSCVISTMDDGDTLSGHVGSPSSAFGTKQRIFHLQKAFISCNSPLIEVADQFHFLALYQGLKLELCTTDRVGLLSAVTRIFRENSLAVTRPEATTKAGKDVNTFYVSDALGYPVNVKNIEFIRLLIGLKLLKVKGRAEELKPVLEAAA
ncbi:hypothetical protein ACFE04_028782 [Oxalis oulophora]